MLWHRLWYFLTHSWFGTSHITGPIYPEVLSGKCSQVLSSGLPASADLRCSLHWLCLPLSPALPCADHCPVIHLPCPGFTCLLLLSLGSSEKHHPCRLTLVSPIPPHLGSHVAQAGLELYMQLRTTLDFWSSCFCLLSARIIGVLPGWSDVLILFYPTKSGIFSHTCVVSCDPFQLWI